MRKLSERICTKYITPALTMAGWDLQLQIREEVSCTAGRINVRGKSYTSPPTTIIRYMMPGEISRRSRGY